MKHQGKTILTVRGPETKATQADVHLVGAEFFGIVFKLGTFIPHLPPQMVMDRRDLNLPEASSKSFWLQGAAWQFPTFDNADTFVERLVREGLLVHDPVVNAVLQDHPIDDLSIRSVRRRFLRATGLTHSYHIQIQRAHRAMTLLREGVSILDTVFEAGYFDQPHLTRSLKHLMGHTPAQVLRLTTPEPMSL
jgi:AraC-like DNA-binding protein